MDRSVPECVFCGEPAEQDADVVTLFGVATVAVCSDCGEQLLDFAGETTDHDAYQAGAR